MSKNDAVGLFPASRQTIEHFFSTEAKRRDTLGTIKISTTLFVQDNKRRRWPIVLECLRTAGQRHVRLNKGWAAMCIANDLSVGKRVLFERWELGSNKQGDSVVTLTVL